MAAVMINYASFLGIIMLDASLTRYPPLYVLHHYKVKIIKYLPGLHHGYEINLCLT